MKERYKVTALSESCSTFEMELTEEELVGAKKLADELANICSWDSLDISFEKI